MAWMTEEMQFDSQPGQISSLLQNIQVPWRFIGQGIRLTTHLHLLQSFHGAIPPFSHMSIWYGAYLGLGTL
jgi:hypothetical protein